MNTPNPVVPAPDARVRPVHHHCQGRVRLEVDGLYRRPTLKPRLERLLLDLDGVRSAQANPITGRVLVLFGADLTVGELAGVIASALDPMPGTAAMPRS
jgi:hypothetical protein